jgi:tripartite-type tricarboxylate transporter receptor subunit TctC
MAQTQDNFYAGKKMTMIVGSSVGGSYDLSARVLARHLGNHIPGNPSIIPRNMPGAGGLEATNYIYTVAPKDGTEIGALSRTVPILPIFGEGGGTFDPRKLNWLGSTVNVVGTAVAWHTAPVKTMDDLMARELVIGGTGAGSQAIVYPTAMNSILGTKFKIIAGYPGSAEVLLAMQRGEVEGFGSWSWSGIEKSGLLRDGKINVLVQLGMKKQPGHPEIPLVLDLAKTADDRAALELIFAPQTFARPFAVSPGVPAARVALLRAAFDATLRDPAFLADADKQKLEVDLVSGQDVQDLIDRLYQSPPQTIARAKAALGESLTAE